MLTCDSDTERLFTRVLIKTLYHAKDTFQIYDGNLIFPQNKSSSLIYSGCVINKSRNTLKEGNICTRKRKETSSIANKSQCCSWRHCLLQATRGFELPQLGLLSLTGQANSSDG